ncbi:MAG: AAA family ATPase [Bacteroidaceae bacterium]|nr:AAA family ATPase [Bacteroidaceae bacterium]
MIGQIAVNMPKARPDCERAVLGYLMSEQDLQGMEAILRPEMFTETSNIAIYNAIETVRKNGDVPDVVNVTTQLLCASRQDAIPHVAEVASEESTYGSFARHCYTLSDLALQRKRVRVLTNAAQSGSDIDDTIAQLQAIKEDFNMSEGLDECEIDLTKDYAEPRYTLRRDDVGTIPRGDIQAIKAKSKNGKSFLCSILIASMLGCKSFGFTGTEANAKVLYVDTEQNSRNTAKLAKRVHAILGWDRGTNHAEFHAYSLRRVDTVQRLLRIRRGIMAHHPTAVFIDGIADLIPDFNDVTQSTRAINELMRLSAEADCAIVCVLHTNKAKDDSGMKGHLGTMLLQKASDVYEVRKNGNTFNVTETDCRNLPVDDFSFLIDGHGIPYMGATQPPQQEDKLTANMRKAFGNNAEMSYSELAKAYMAHTLRSIATAKRHIGDALESGIIEVGVNNLYKMC